jgi:ribosome biogenesis GTPase A
MAASLRGLGDFIKQADCVLYVLDARCPRSCLNPAFEEFTKRKPVIFVLNKSDLAPAENEFFTAKNSVRIDATKANARDKIIAAVRALFPTKTRVQAFVIGVPNSGKSTVINNLARAAKTQTQNRPGVTRIPQWVAAAAPAGFSLFLLDTPGILYPDIKNDKVGENLAFIGSIKDDILDIEGLAREILTLFFARKSLEDFATERGHIHRGKGLDLNRAARTVLTEFRSGKFGKVDLDARVNWHD